MFNILVVEDDFNTRRLMCAVLERYGYNPIPATDGVDALEQMDKKHVDLVILDIMMPRMGGYEFTRVLREGGNTLPILIVSERKLTVGSTVLYYDSLTVRSDGEAVGAPGGLELPQKEFLLLFKLLSYPNKIFTRRQLMDEIWDMESESDERTVDVHISRVRERFRGNTDFEIITVRGLGYKAVYLK